MIDRRQEIIAAATKSFTLFGYKATTMDQVAKIANVGKGTIYTFFSNKEELFQEIAMTLIREMRIQTSEVITDEANFMDNAHAALMKLLEFREEHLLFAKLIEEEKELRTPIVRQVLIDIESAIIVYIAAYIQKAIDRDEIYPCDTELVSYLLFKGYLAFVVDWSELHDEILPEGRILNLFKDTIFKGLIKA
ncbi:TetR family transcriptional regulator [Lysinibacillus alkalisoli]|uniref:TetR family transcriptional regulator n=1 Tax=Lysinibacillus alkalisoli TaxID=1911548 RepID=A0A917G5W9_9BACI|nr:TetR family transcriptional regulator [Lysinibacillus alkalisoli]